MEAASARSIHRASLAEMVVPYGDPTGRTTSGIAFDAGEYGIGMLANSLELGCDCLGNIHYFDVPAATVAGQPCVIQNAICMHEEDYGHCSGSTTNCATACSRSRRSRRLVVSFFATVGNYEYGFYWYFYQDGTLQLEVKLTGIIQPPPCHRRKVQWGGMVRRNLRWPMHQHFFNVRLHMDLDGGGNTVTEHEFVPRPWGADNPHGNAFDTTTRVLSRERDAAPSPNGETGRFWKISNPNETRTASATRRPTSSSSIRAR